jgi:hypothetical protein
VKEYIKVKLNIINQSLYQKSIEKFNSFLFSLELPMQYKNTFEAHIKESSGNELLLRIRDKYVGNTDIPLSKLSVGSKIFVLNSTNRQEFTYCAEAIVLKRYFEAAERSKSTIQKFKPLTSENSEIQSLNFSFSQKEFDWIKLGYTPSSMEEKWHIFFEEDTLHFVRSWTNTEIFRLKLNKSKNSYFVNEVQKNMQIGDIEVLEKMLNSITEKGRIVFDK